MNVDNLSFQTNILINTKKQDDSLCLNTALPQALLANMAAMYAVYHGAEGLYSIAEKVHYSTCIVAEGTYLVIPIL